MVDINRKYNSLTVLKQVESNKGKRYLCVCDCGNTKIIYGFRIESGHTKSCGCLKNKPLSEERKNKISAALSDYFYFSCETCNKEVKGRRSHFKMKKHHFCSRDCYSKYVKERPFHLNNSYKGIRSIGENKQIYHRRYVKNNPEIISHLKARRYAREKNAEGSHSLKEWQEMKIKCKNRCLICGEEKPLTKDHIKPLSKGGTDYIDNIQPLCRSCNSRKNNKYPELLEVSK